MSIEDRGKSRVGEGCQTWRLPLSENARAGEPPRGLAAHLAACPDCRRHWEDERSLGAELQVLREAYAGERSADVWRRRLMAEFSRVAPSPSRFWFRLAWVPVAAAVLVAASLQIWIAAPPRAARESAAVQSEELTAPSAEVDEEGFVPVPYALPLAPGESVRIVRAELNGADLVRMGIELPGADAADLSDDFEANVVLGEDDVPRAVQLVTDPQEPSSD